MKRAENERPCAAFMNDEVGVSRFFPRAALMLAIASVTLSACNRGESQSPAGNPQRGGGPGGARGANAQIVVEIAPVEDGRIARSVTVSGNVEPIRVVGVNSQLSGALRTVSAEEGSVVREGTVLATLDDREISAQLASAEAAFQVADAAWQRAERLRERQVITAAEYERDRAAFAAAQAQREQLRARVGYATVRSPINGVVTVKNVEAGDIVGIQNELFRIADVSTMVVRVRVSELDVVAIKAGDIAQVMLDAFPGQVLNGRVRRVFPAADPTSRLVPVEVALTGADAAAARPGFLARVTFALGAKENVHLVPASAIVTDATGSQAVYVVENGRALRKLVRTGVTSEGRVEIVDGVQAGEMVVITGTNNLRDGAAVRVVNAAAPIEGESRPEGGNQP
jgi:RND family efflux transporter MFP subunit